MYDKANMVYHQLPEAFSPPVYSKKIDVKLHDSVIFTPCFNHNYDGDAKGPGSEIVIRSKPEIVAHAYKPGTPVSPQRVDSRARSVKVGRSWEVSMEIHDWEKMNTDLPAWLDLHSYDVSQAAREHMEDEWFGEADAELAASPFASRNAGAAAGEFGTFNLGTDASPVALSAEGPTAAASASKRNVVDLFYDLNMVYSQHTGAGRGFKYAIVPLEVCDLMLRFDAFYRSASPAALPEMLSADVSKFGAHPVTGFNMLVSRRLKPKVVNGTKVFFIYFGDSNAWSWVDLGSVNGMFKDVDNTPGKDVDYNIGYYDRWLADPRYFGVAKVTI